MIVVFFESKSHAELGGIFPSEEIYVQCLPALEAYAEKKGMKVTESMDSGELRSCTREILKSEGFFTDNLWSVSDVMDNYDCDEEQAQKVLKEAFSNEATYDQIWLSISFAAEKHGVFPKQ